MEAHPNFPSLQLVADRLAQWSFDTPSASLTFAGRLARENGWSMRQAARVMEEYRRFLLLAVTAGHFVCPSDAVDQAWHLHLLDSRAYWEEFCPRVLGQPLHHSPSKGGAEEGARLREGYQRTLASYEAAFGARPPTDIWPAVEERFRRGSRWQRLETSRCWILPRPRLGAGLGAIRRGWIGRGALVLVGLGGSGCGALASTGAVFPLSLSGPEFLFLYGILAWLCLALAREGCDLLAREPGIRRTDQPTFSPMEMAFLAGQEQRTVKTAILRLVLEGRVEPVGHGFRTLSSQPATADTPLDMELLREMNGRSPVGESMIDIMANRRDLLAPIRRSLEEQGLVCTDSALAKGRLWAAILLGGLWLLGVLRLAQGIGAGQPVGFLMFGLLFVTWKWFQTVINPPRLTRRGEEMRKQLNRSAASNGDGTADQSEMDNQLCAFALLGWVSLSTTLAGSLAMAGLQTAQPFISISGVEGGADGGGCGGGCGGCGGCGG